MALGLGGRFFSQLSFCLRQGLTLREALDLIAGDVRIPGWAEALRRAGARIDGGETLGKALSELPAPFPREILPFVEEMESLGILVDELDLLAAWPDEGAVDPPALLARIFAHASILIRRREPITDALRHAVRPGDPDVLKDAIRAVSKASVLDQSFADVMGEFPRIFSPALRRLVLQMERNGDAARTFRELALALAGGWFLAEDAPPGAPRA